MFVHAFLFRVLETSVKMHREFQRSSTGVDQVTGWAVSNKPFFLLEDKDLNTSGLTGCHGLGIIPDTSPYI